MHRRDLGLGLCGLLMLVALAPDLVARLTDARPVSTEGRLPNARAQPSTPVEVSLDERGRPYDVVLFPETRVERKRLTTLHAPSRQIVVMGGEYAPIATEEEGGAPITLAERAGRRYPVDVIWARRKGHADPAGVIVVERDAPVAEWREFSPEEYGTDGGVGAITTVEWVRAFKGEETELSRRFDEFDTTIVADVDGAPGADTVIFSNGFGDGGFPSVAGYDAAGERLAIVIWHLTVPWRLAFPEGTPPSQVTARERELAECLAGKRKVYGATCRPARS